METRTDKPWENQKLWLRLLIMIVLGFFYWFCQFIIFAFAIVQLGFLLIAGERCAPVHKFSYRFSLYVKQLVDFLLFTSETRPFPFSDFPEQKDNGKSSAAGTADTTGSARHGVTATATTSTSVSASGNAQRQAAPKNSAGRKKTAGKKHSRKAGSTKAEPSASGQKTTASAPASPDDDKENNA